MDFEIAYTSREITPWGGMVLLRQMLDKLRFREGTATLSDLPKPGSNAGYDPVTIIEAFIASVWCGANRFLHTEVTRHDPAIAQIFGWKRSPGQDTYKRFFAKISGSQLHRLREDIYRWVFSKVRFDNYTLDCDSTIFTRYGQQQQGAKRDTIQRKEGAHPTIPS